MGDGEGEVAGLAEGDAVGKVLVDYYSSECDGIGPSDDDEDGQDLDGRSQVSIDSQWNIRWRTGSNTKWIMALGDAILWTTL